MLPVQQMLEVIITNVTIMLTDRIETITPNLIITIKVEVNLIKTASRNLL